MVDLSRAASPPSLVCVEAPSPVVRGTVPCPAAKLPNATDAADRRPTAAGSGRKTPAAAPAAPPCSVHRRYAHRQSGAEHTDHVHEAISSPTVLTGVKAAVAPPSHSQPRCRPRPASPAHAPIGNGCAASAPLPPASPLCRGHAPPDRRRRPWPPPWRATATADRRGQQDDAAAPATVPPSPADRPRVAPRRPNRYSSPPKAVPLACEARPLRARCPSMPLQIPICIADRKRARRCRACAPAGRQTPLGWFNNG